MSWPRSLFLRAGLEMLARTWLKQVSLHSDLRADFAKVLRGSSGGGGRVARVQEGQVQSASFKDPCDCIIGSSQISQDYLPISRLLASIYNIRFAI